MVRDADAATDRDAASRRGLGTRTFRVDEPTLENTFVATLRAFGQEIHTPPFPGRHLHRQSPWPTRDWCEGLTKRFGDFTAVNHVERPRPLRRNLWPARRQWRRQDHHHQDALRPARTHHGRNLARRRAGQPAVAEVRARSATCPRNFPSTTISRIDENLTFFAGVYGVPADELTKRRKWVLAFSGLEGKQQLITGSLPGGWKQRVAFGAAIMHEPGVLFLDEPTSGVDPLARRAFWRMINSLADVGTAILVTTHYLEEAEQCNRLGFMVAGELVAEGTPRGVKQQIERASP